MEIGGVFRDFIQSIINLIVNGHAVIERRDVFHGDLDAFPERHRPIAIEGITGIDADHQRTDRGKNRFVSESRGKEISHRTFHAGVFLAVIINTQDGVTIIAGGSHPDLLDAAGTCDVGQHQGLAGVDSFAGLDFPAHSEFPGSSGQFPVFIDPHWFPGSPGFGTSFVFGTN